MSKKIIVSGLILLVCQVVGLRLSYLDGLNFIKTSGWSLITGLVFFVTLIVLFIFIVYEALVAKGWRNRAINASALVIVPVILFSISAIPHPGFLDGIDERVSSSMTREYLMEFAETARDLELPNRFIEREQYNQSFEFLKRKYPEAFALLKHDPGIDMRDDSVMVVYGSGLTKHWGYAVTLHDQCPLDYLTDKSCRRVFENVWVFDDIY